MLSRVKIIIGIFTLYLFVLVQSAPLWAADEPPAAKSTAAESSAPTTQSDEPDSLSWLDQPRDYLSGRITTLSDSMDAFFANDRVFEESSRTFVRIYGDLSYAEARASDFTIKVQAKLVLPALERRLKILIESDDTPPDGSDQTNTVSTISGMPNVDVPKGFRAAVQVLLKDTVHWNVSTDGGIRIHRLLPNLFVRERARREQTMGDWVFRLTQAAYWYEQSGAGATLQFDADRKITDRRLGRSHTGATWSDHDQQYLFEQSFSLFQGIDQRNAMSYQLGIFGANQPNSHVISYSLGAKWRHRLHREWLFTEVQPLVSWSEGQDFRPTTSILFRLEAILGGVGCGCYGL